MADPTFIITPSGSDYSMVSDEFFNSLGTNQYITSVSRGSALDWLLNIKKFCVTEESDGQCLRGIYEATYGIEDYASYATPVTSLGGSYKEPQIGGLDSSTSTGAAGQVMQTSPRNPHRYILQSDPNNAGSPPPQLTGEYLGAFFRHKGRWYASFDDFFNVGGGPANSKQITGNRKIAEAGSSKKKIYVQDKFYPNGSAANIEECRCLPPPCNFSISENGGSTPFSEIYELNRAGIPTTLQIGFDAQTVGDSITVTSDSGPSYSSGCIIGYKSVILNLPNGAETITVVVTPNCDGGAATLWSFSITCIDDEPP